MTAGAPPELYIHVERWDEFQHYKNRDPLWIKSYTRLLYDRRYIGLSFRMRGLLHGIWLLYAASGRDLGASPAQIGRMLGDTTVRMRDLVSLSDAGFITISASKVLSQSRERVEEIRTPSIPLAGEAAYSLLVAIGKPGYDETKFTRKRFADLVAHHQDADLAAEASALADWEQHGGGEGEQTKDGIARFRNWLKRATPTKERRDPLDAYPRMPRADAELLA